ncbi:MAG TPA: hypothetical protein VM054_07005, partial [bacterium]|nr:hypothetical protein [bacterium]
MRRVYLLWIAGLALVLLFPMLALSDGMDAGKKEQVLETGDYYPEEYPYYPDEPMGGDGGETVIQGS